jgi:hypothetical protein
MPVGKRKKADYSKLTKRVTTKKLKGEGLHSDHGNGGGFDELDALVLHEIFSFLDAKSLFRVAFSTRRMMEVVDHQHVIQSAIVSGGHSAKTVTDVINLALVERQIFLPSPLRLLRLANGKRCELSKKCQLSLVNHTRSALAVFACWPCFCDSTQKISRTDSMLDNGRVARNSFIASAYVQRSPMTDAAGERIGAIVTRTECMRRLKDAGAILQEYDENDPYTQEKRNLILEAFEKAKKERSIRSDKNNHAKMLRQVNRQEKAEKLTVLLKTLIEDDVPFKEALCAHIPMVSESQKEACIRFRCQFVDWRMKPFLIAPSKGTKKKLKEIADQITADLNLLMSTGFLDFSCLSSDAREEPFESSLRVHMGNAFSPEQVLHAGFESDPDREVWQRHRNYKNQVLFLEQIRQGRVLEAMFHWFTPLHENDFTRRHPFVEAFADSAFIQVPENVEVENASMLAMIVWQVHRTESLPVDWSVTNREFKAAYKSVCTEAAILYPRLLHAALEYLNEVETETTGYPDGADGAHIEDTKRRMKLIWDKRQTVELLAKKDFGALKLFTLQFR